jgi:hypothetical protein
VGLRVFEKQQSAKLTRYPVVVLTSFHPVSAKFAAAPDPSSLTKARDVIMLPQNVSILDKP